MIGYDVDGPLCEYRPLPFEAAPCVGILNDLQSLFLPFTVDLTLLDETHSVFQSEVIGGICIYAETAAARSKFELWVLTRAADFLPVLDAFHRERLENT